MNHSDEKKILRAKARARRAELAASSPDHAVRLAAYTAALNIPAHAIVGGYVALPGEADPAHLLARLQANGHIVALPRVEAKGTALRFHRWQPGDALAPGAFGVPEPDPAWPRAVPSAVLVPLVAFDAAGYRLGYGGGYYDRTLAAFRARGPILAIGIAYAGQEVASLPHDDFDAPLDMVLTETGVRGFNGTQ